MRSFVSTIRVGADDDRKRYLWGSNLRGFAMPRVVEGQPVHVYEFLEDVAP